jgi:hypothetical protein
MMIALKVTAVHLQYRFQKIPSVTTQSSLPRNPLGRLQRCRAAGDSEGQNLSEDEMESMGQKLRNSLLKDPKVASTNKRTDYHWIQ